MTTEVSVNGAAVEGWGAEHACARSGPFRGGSGFTADKTDIESRRRAGTGEQGS